MSPPRASPRPSRRRPSPGAPSRPKPGLPGPAAADAGAVAERLHKAAIRLLRGLRRQDEASGLTAPRLSALSVLVFAGPRTLGELAAAEQVRPPTMTKLVHALEAEGLARRESDPADGRRTLVVPTARGRRVLLAGRERRLAALREGLARLSPAEVVLLGRAAEIMLGLGAESAAKAVSEDGARQGAVGASSRRRRGISRGAGEPERT